MKDREFLIWLHERLVEVHGEVPEVDYMHKLRAIIRDTRPLKATPNQGTGNNMADLLKLMAED